MASKQQPEPTANEPAEAEAVEVPVALYYAGGPVYGDAPMRDLSDADLEYLARVKGLRESGGQPFTPASEDIRAVKAELVKSGAFTKDAPSAPASPAEETGS